MSLALSPLRGVFLVLPVLRVTPAPVTAGICFVVLALYLLYIAKCRGLISWYYSYAVPICVVICAMVALTTGLISKKIATGIHIPALLFAEAAVFLIFLEALYDFNQLGRLNLRWSLITMCVFRVDIRHLRGGRICCPPQCEKMSKKERTVSKYSSFFQKGDLSRGALRKTYRELPR